MSLADRLRGAHRAPLEQGVCAVCIYYDTLSVEERADFDAWIADGGSVTALWRACAADPVHPVQVRAPRFRELINDHHRGGSRVAC